MATDEKNIEALEAELERLRKLVFSDDLTGVFNRRGFNEEANKIFRALYQTPTGDHERRSTRDLPFSVILLDADNFKQLNDTYGHDAGDAALKGIAQVISATVRSYDIVGRWGGEEFIVALPGANSVIAEHVAERIRHGVEHMDLIHDGRPIPVTVSIGIAGHALEATLTDLIKAADEAMYRAKETGKNRVVVFGTI